LTNQSFKPIRQTKLETNLAKQILQTNLANQSYNAVKFFNVKITYLA
jgi:hypothetical protein